MLTSSTPRIEFGPAPLLKGASARPTAVRWRILIWIVLASIVGYVLRFNLSVAAPSMMHDRDVADFHSLGTHQI